jgi:hypothetical protein
MVGSVFHQSRCLGCLPLGFGRPGVVVCDVEPPRLPICVGVNKLVRQVLLRGVFSQLDAGSSDYSWVGGTWLRLDPEELPEEDPVRLDPKESLAKMHEDCGMKNTVGVQIQVLDSIVPEETLEEIASREREPALHEPRKHWNLVFGFLHRIWISGGGPPHVNLLLPDESTVQEGQEIFGLHFGFLPLAAWIGPWWRHWQHCSGGSRSGLFAAPLLPSGLRTLGQ